MLNIKCCGYKNEFLEWKGSKRIVLETSIVKHSLKNHEQFYDKLRIVKRWKAFKRIVSYKIEIVDSKVVSAQLEASKSSIKY